MPTTTSTQFDLTALTHAIEHRDAAAQLALYAPDAVVSIVDRDRPPSSPELVVGADAISTWINDVCSRDLTHRVTGALASGDRAAIQVACRYADGTAVLCSAMLELRDGRIARQSVVQAWDA